MKTLIFHVIAIMPVWSLIGQQITPVGNNKGQDLENKVEQLEQTLTNLQSQTQIQDQKYAADLQSVLTKLTSTTDDLSAVKQTLTLTSDELDGLKYESNETKHELAMLRNEHNSTQLEIAKLKGEYNTAQLELTKLKSEHNATLLELVTLWKGHNASQVAANQLTTVTFQVKGIPETLYVTDINNQQSNIADLKFDSEIVNKGKGYDPSTGRFTAPVDGIYMFWANLHSQQKSTTLSLIRDGQVEISATDSDAHDNVIIIEIFVKRGEMVWCRAKEGANNNNHLSSSSDTYFGGLLVQADHSPYGVSV